MDVVREKLNSFILDPKNHDLLSILKGARNGLVYGAKVRFPHALVMVFLFRTGTLRQKLIQILNLTKTHARNLALFVTIYKSTMLLLRRISTDNKERSSDSFFAGLLGGYLIFGRSGSENPVNQQIVVYVFARVVLALAKVAVQRGVVPDRGGRLRDGGGWGVFAAVSWGCVMWLFRWEGESLQGSLRSSMKYLYVDSDSWDSLRNLIIHNT